MRGRLVHRGLTSKERRRFHRIVYEAQATLSDSERAWSVHLIDVSLHGCLVKSPPDWPGIPGMEFKLGIELSESIKIRMNLVAVRIAEEQIGFRCTHIDLDSICELRRLIELNLGDSTLLERDFSSLTAA